MPPCLSCGVFFKSHEPQVIERKTGDRRLPAQIGFGVGFPQIGFAQAA